MYAYAEKKQATTDKRTSDSRRIPSQMRTASPNQTGISDTMKAHFENLSGFSFDDVRVHYNSDKPAQLQALAYTQGNQVYIAPGQEKHLGHELGHVVQQKQGRVEPTTKVDGVAVNDDAGLEREADNGVTPQTKTRKDYKTAYESNQPIQRAIQQAPTPTNHAGIIGRGGAPMDMGLVQPINGAISPTYQINVHQKEDGNFEANIVVTQNAFEGNSDGIYRQRELFPTGLMLVGGALGAFTPGGNNLQVYGDLSSTNSDLSRIAEQEHLDDLRRAFEITLDLAEGAYNDASNAGPYVGATQALAHAAAAAAINNFIVIRANQLGIATAINAATNHLGLLQTYQNKEQLTQTRDANLWHTFDIDRNHQSQSPLAWAQYFLSLLPGAERKDFREIIPNANNFQVPGPPSNQVVV